MVDEKQIRFVTTNYFNLQGLRAIPLGLCLLLVSLWANAVEYPVKNFLVPITSVVGSGLFLFVIDRYYLRTFGRVQRTLDSRRLEWMISVVGGILALGAFWLDTTTKLPISLLGLVFAAGLLADYLRMTWLVKGRSLLYYPIGAILMAGMSILPQFIPDWWQTCGIKSQIIGMTISFGLFTILAGIWGHIYLLRTLPPVSRGEIS